MIGKKLLAGAMALSMCIASLPVQPASAAVEDAPDDGYEYIYYEDFETSGYDKTWRTETTNSRWKSSREDGAIIYTLKDNTQSNSGDNRYPIKTLSFGTSYPLEDTAYYEAGYSVNFNGFNFSTEDGMFGWNIGGGVVNNYLGAGSINRGTPTIEGKTLSNVDGWIHVKVIFNIHGDTWTQNGDPIDGGRYTTTITYREKGKSEDTVIEVAEKSFKIQTTDTSEIDKAKKKYVKGFQQFKDATGLYSNPTVADGANFMIDNLYVRKLETYEVTFDQNYEGAPTAEVVDTDLAGGVKTLSPTRDGWAFEGWYNDAECTDAFIPSGINSDRTAYANWVKLHTVTFDATGGTAYDKNGNAVTSIETTLESPEELTLPVATQEGFYFNGWYYMDGDTEKEFDGTDIKGNMDVYAKWITAYKISYDGNGATLSRSYDWGRGYVLADLILNPKWEGYRFDGWFMEDGTAYWTPDMQKSAVEVVEDITIKAKWTKKYEVSFRPNGGTMTFDSEKFDVATEANKIYTLENIDLSELPIPTKAGGTFEYWCTDVKCTIPWDGTVTEDITVYAKFNNIIFFEDFEDESENDYYSQLAAPVSWKDLVKEGGGIVTDPDTKVKNNKVFRMMSEGANSSYIEFADAGPGLYEISFKIYGPGEVVRPGSPWNLSNNTRFGDLVQWGTYITSQYTTAEIGTDTWRAGAVGWVNCRYVYDTVNGLVSWYADWTDSLGKSGSTKLENHELRVKSSTYGIDAISFIQFSYHDNPYLSENYIDDICVKKVEQPYVVSITPADGATDISRTPTVTVTFSEAMNRNQITESTVWIEDSEGTKIPATVTAKTENEITVATLVPNAPLAYESNYTVNVSTGISNTSSYYLDKAYKTTFKTIPNVFEVRAEIANASGAQLTTLSGVKSGEKLSAKLYLRNFSGKDTESYFVAAKLTDKTGKMLWFESSAGSLAKLDGRYVLDTEFTAPKDLSTDCRVEFFVWNSVLDRGALWENIVLP